MPARSAPPRIVLATTLLDAVSRRLRAALPDADLRQTEMDELLKHVEEADVIVPTVTPVGEEVFARASRLRLVQQWGTGLDGVDIAAATRHGVPVAHVPSAGSGNAASVAEWCVMAALALSRQLPQARQHVHEGGPWWDPTGRALLGKRAGLLGFGGVGQALAVRLRPFGMKLRAVKRTPDPQLAEQFGLDWLGGAGDRQRLLRESDYLFLCLPLSEETRGLIGAEAFARLPDGAFLINAARGPIVEREALEAALAGERLAGAALDVYWEEPVAAGDPLFEHPRLLATPHIAGATDASLDGTGSVVAENIRRVMDGEPPRHCVNLEEIER